jgi:hypothetical protein
VVGELVAFADVLRPRGTPEVQQNRQSDSQLTRKAGLISKSKKKKNKKKNAVNKAEEAEKVNGDQPAAQAEEHDEEAEDEEDQPVRLTIMRFLISRLTWSD